MKIVEHFLTRNRCYQAAKQNTKGGLMLHSVGCPQPSAQVFVNSWNSADKSVCVHAFIDANTGDVYQTLPWISIHTTTRVVTRDPVDPFHALIISIHTTTRVVTTTLTSHVQTFPGSSDSREIMLEIMF